MPGTMNDPLEQFAIQPANHQPVQDSALLREAQQQTMLLKKLVRITRSIEWLVGLPLIIGILWALYSIATYHRPEMP